MSESSKFTWIPFYEEFARKLALYKDDRASLVEKVKKLDEWIGFIKARAENQDFDDIDPYTVFAIFNRSSKTEKRQRILSKIKELFGVETLVPQDFDAIPLVNAQKSCFYYENEKKETIPMLWELFSLFIAGDYSSRFCELFDSAQQKHGIRWNLTMACFWMKPKEFMPLDANSRSYLKKLGVNVFKRNNLLGLNYLNLVKKVKGVVNEPYEVISDKAWKSSEILEINGLLAQDNSGSWPDDLIQEMVDKDCMGSFWWHEMPVGTTETLKALRKKLEEDENFDLFICRNKQAVYRASVVDFVTSQEEYEKKRSSWEDTCWLRETFSEFNDHDGKRSAKILFIVDEMEKLDDFIPMNLFEYSMNYKKPHMANMVPFKKIEEKITDKVEGEMSNKDDLKEYVDLLMTNRNIILHGAPGTGKTYLARQIAASMMFEKNYEALSENEQSQIGFVQFHPSYDYTDFVEGLRPTKTGSFERTNGIFKDFCVNAQDNFVESGKDEKSYTKDVLVRDLFEKFCLDIERQLLEKESVTLYEKSILRIRQVHRQKDGSAYSIRLAKDAESSTQGLKLAIVERDYQNFKDGKIKSYEDVKPTNDSKSPFHGNAIYYFELYKKLAEFEKKEFGNRQKLDQQEKVTRKNFVFIIDEINRGDMSKIFGELFFAIDPSYRGVRGKIKTQYQNLYEDEDEDYFANGFFVPENVYIIGTMNDIDRSVESMDFAMRRRFAFEEVTAEQSAANFNPPLSAEALKRMSNLNNAIWDDKENKGITGLSSAYHIGPAYFKDFKDGDDKDRFWNRRLKSLLTEYLRGSRNASKDIETLKDAFMGE